MAGMSTLTLVAEPACFLFKPRAQSAPGQLVPPYRSRIFWRLTFALLLIVVYAPLLRAEKIDVEVPVELDYPLLQQLLIKQLFTGPGQSRDILDDTSGCSQVVLTNPQVNPHGETLEIVAEVRAHLGVSVMGNCNSLLDWQGGVGFLGLPVIQPQATSVRLEPSESWLLAADGSRVTSGEVWDLARDQLQAILGGFTIDLASYTETLGAILPEVLPGRPAEQLQAIIDSVTLNSIEVAPENLKVSLNFEIDELPESTAEPVLSPTELQQWEESWQTMDALLVYAVKHYAAATNFDELRVTLLDILIDSRYQLRDALAQPVDRSNDLVRSWFLQSWKRLGPIVRSIGLEQEGQEPLLWFSVLTATDALSALDQLGPGIGLDISADGLRRLARLVNQGEDFEALRYDEAIDPELQQLFQLRLQPEAAKPGAFRFDLSPISPAYAEAPSDKLNSWVPRTDELIEYLPMVATLLDTSADGILLKQPLNKQHQKLFKQMVLATAWQESCWRQYIVKSNRIETLRSGTGDVGLMQINERVWRGFYDLQKLRWDIGYNSQAGAEVLINYLVKYALKQGEQKRAGGLDNLARASYSAYNGGPSQVSRYRRSDVSPGHKKIDTAFWEKYQQVKAGNELAVARCLGGDVGARGSPARARTDKASVGSSRKTGTVADDTTAENAGEQWLLVQQENHFTLQLGAFSQRSFAARFISQESLPAPVHIISLRQGNTTQYLVLHGSFNAREDAGNVKQRFKHLQPWLRQFGQLRNSMGL
jgi:septal ring-binding cell division protein DamX